MLKKQFKSKPYKKTNINKKQKDSEKIRAENEYDKLQKEFAQKMKEEGLK